MSDAKKWLSSIEAWTELVTPARGRLAIFENCSVEPGTCPEPECDGGTHWRVTETPAVAGDLSAMIRRDDVLAIVEKAHKAGQAAYHGRGCCAFARDIRAAILATGTEANDG